MTVKTLAITIVSIAAGITSLFAGYSALDSHNLRPIWKGEFVELSEEVGYLAARSIERDLENATANLKQVRFQLQQTRDLKLRQILLDQESFWLRRIQRLQRQLQMRRR